MLGRSFIDCRGNAHVKCRTFVIHIQANSEEICNVINKAGERYKLVQDKWIDGLAANLDNKLRCRYWCQAEVSAADVLWCLVSLDSAMGFLWIWSSSSWWFHRETTLSSLEKWDVISSTWGCCLGCLVPDLCWSGIALLCLSCSWC